VNFICELIVATFGLVLHTLKFIFALIVQGVMQAVEVRQNYYNFASVKKCWASVWEYRYTWLKNDVISSVRKHNCASGLRLRLGLGLELGLVLGLELGLG